METLQGSTLESQPIWEVVEENHKPKVGMIFDTLEEGEEFYRKYAKIVGFSVRKYSTMVDKVTNVKYSQQFVCSKQGMPKERDTPKEGRQQRCRSTIRENCEAAVRFQKNANGKWVIMRFIANHSHDPVTPRRKQFLTINREVTEAQRSLLSSFKETNLRTSQFVSFLEVESGSRNNIGCTERDIRNILAKEKKELKDYDAQILMEHFGDEKEMDPSFYFTYKADEDNKLTHVLWADSLARKAYHNFGDVLIFDTTYDTNEYRLVFAPFTGVNHYGQSVNFGAGFMNDERTISFVWLFETWKEAMCGPLPKLIITDQDSAIEAAIKQSFPDAVHRYCMWHILKKTSQKLGAFAYNSEFTIPFYSCIWNSDTTKEFEINWKMVIEKNNLQNHDWLNDIYSFRHKWIPAYAKENNIFTAGIRSTQRAESMNAFIDRYVNVKNSLTEFVTRFERAIRKQRHNELAAEHETYYTKVQLQTNLEMERQMSDIYTRGKFSDFQNEIYKSLNYGSMLIRIDGVCRVYIVKKIGHSKNQKQASEVEKEVIYQGPEKAAICICKKLETDGIPCRHLLVVLKNEFVETLPSCYILKRWTRSAASSINVDNNGKEIQANFGAEQDLSFTELSNDIHKFIRVARTSKETTTLAKSLIQKATKEIEQSMGAIIEQEKKKELPVTIEVHPPDIAKTKGSGKRLKSGKETAMEVSHKPPRMCRCCKRFTHHDSRNCPLKERLAFI